MIIVIVLLVALVTAGVISHSFTKKNVEEETPVAPEKVEPDVTHKHTVDFSTLPSISSIPPVQSSVSVVNEESVNTVKSTLTTTPEPKKKVTVSANPTPKPKVAPVKRTKSERHKLSAIPAPAPKKGTPNKK